MTTSRKASKTGSDRRVKGSRAVQKGKEFEDRVAGLYRLLGAYIVQNIEVCQKKVDILATFQLPGTTTPHRIIVECKAERTATAQNQRVMQFAGLLDLARKAGEADSAEIVTQVAWGDLAKGFARARNIALLTYEQKVSQLLDFVPYLRRMIAEYEDGVPDRPQEPPLAKYYVQPSVETVGSGKVPKRIADVNKFITAWLQRSSGRQLALLGEYGTGKTCFCLKLTHDFASKYLLDSGTTRIPLLFNLRDFTKTLSIESLITSFLDGVCGVPNPRYQLFKTMNEAGVFLLVFDGFDEMAVRVDADTLEMNLREIEKLASHANSRVLLTSRTEYFVSAEEQARVLQPRGQLLATRDTEYEPVKIQPWKDAKVELFLQRRVPLVPGIRNDWTFYRDKLRIIPGLSDLARRPVLLEMIVKTLPQLIASGQAVNRPNLYHTYLIGELKRQKVVKQRVLLMAESTRLEVLERLAAKFYQEDEASITFSEALAQLKIAVRPPSSELEAHARDFLNCSFLIRDGDKFRFSHRSIMQYLVAKALFREIASNRPMVFQKAKLDWVIAGFIAEMEPQTETLWEWIEQTKTERGIHPTYMGGNAVTLLCLRDRSISIERDLSGTDLTGAQFESADLTRTTLKGALLKNVDLHSARVEEAELRTAEIGDAVFSLWLLLDHRKGSGVSESAVDKLITNLSGHLGGSSPESTPLQWMATSARGLFFCYLVLRCGDLDALARVRERFSTSFPVKATAVSFSEVQELRAKVPKEMAHAVNHIMGRRLF